MIRAKRQLYPSRHALAFNHLEILSSSISRDGGWPSYSLGSRLGSRYHRGRNRNRKSHGRDLCLSILLRCRSNPLQLRCCQYFQESRPDTVWQISHRRQTLRTRSQTLCQYLARSISSSVIPAVSGYRAIFVDVPLDDYLRILKFRGKLSLTPGQCLSGPPYISTGSFHEGTS